MAEGEPVGGQVRTDAVRRGPVLSCRVLGRRSAVGRAHRRGTRRRGLLMAGPEPIPGCDVPGTHIWGWMRIPELEWLMSKAREMDSVVEVGSLHGRSAFAMLTACTGPVYCIDPWDDEHDLCERSFMGNCGHFP